MTSRKPPHITITDQNRGLPYSKGLMASSLSVSGLPPSDAFAIAEKIEDLLLEERRFSITSDDLRELAASLLSEAGERYAQTYLQWQQVEELETPLIILLGGATGVGKSTVATQLAARLGITRVISTDAIREVLRSVFAPELMPTLHVSSFDADRTIPYPPTTNVEPVIIGFREQVQAVSVGIKALITRALEEGTDIIVEGAHVVPGFLEGWDEEFTGAVILPVVMTVGDEDLHRSHFHIRAIETRSRPHDRYLASFEKIRLIQRHIESLAASHGVPVVEAYDIDSTIQEIVALVVRKALDVAEGSGEELSVPRTFSVDDEGEVVRKQKLLRVKSWEVLGRRKHP